MTTIRAPWRALGLMAIAALALAACTGGSSPAASAPASVAASAAASVAASPSAAASASAEASPAASEAGDEYELKVATGAVGKFLTGVDGKTLYTFMPDTTSPGKSSCNAGCATTWPPFVVDPGEEATAGEGVTAADIATVTRDDGKTQVSYKGHPLYYYSKDAKAGDTNGQGLGGIWFVAAP